ncbi:di-heme oxidoredictase family protein [Pandoraea sputorum]
MQEATLWHGGEAQASRERFRGMTSRARTDPLRLLMSL